MAVLVTGGAGFIGSCFVREWLAGPDPELVVDLDKLTYAGCLESLGPARDHPRHKFVHGDICDEPLLRRLFAEHRPRAVIHFAAESHVDRSIDGPDAFLETNILGTHALLKAALVHWRELAGPTKPAFRFLYVNTDEVYGSAAPDEFFSETTNIRPNSPYAATKAAAGHLVRAYQHTFGLPTLTTSCSNNYGPYQFPEKLLPLMILNTLEGQPLPVYGDGQQIRDWLHVADHCSGIKLVLDKGEPGEVYNIGGEGPRKNLDVVHLLCDTVDRLYGPLPHGPSRGLIKYVTDRPGHDRRYAIDSTKIRTQLGWKATYDFPSGLENTVRWYHDSTDWLAVARAKYDRQRLGKG
jgi:dTDP-glucose 4,6-dehydratase